MTARPTPPLPSLRALQAFTYVVDTRSIAQAADRLGVTPSAVSHLMRTLEDQIGTPLLLRERGTLGVTREGELLHAALAPAFGQIGEAVAQARRRRAELRLSTLNTFAQRWLMPRLARFQARAPHVELFVSTTTRAVDLTAEGVDAAIRWGRGRWTGLAAELLYREVSVAVAHPALAARVAGAPPAAVLDLPLVHGRLRRHDWPDWLAAARVAAPTELPGLTVETRALAVQAALAGAGAAVIDRAFVSTELTAGLLVQLGSALLERDEGYWLVWPEARPAGGGLLALRAWLREEVASA